jgi:hypothetical protein
MSDIANIKIDVHAHLCLITTALFLENDLIMIMEYFSSKKGED